MGTSFPLKSHIILSPAVPDRFGAQWHNAPLLTNDFEARFTIILRPNTASSGPHADQGFAFWCVTENVTASIPAEIPSLVQDVSTRLAALGWGLFGYKEQYDGFGIFFAYNSATGELKPSVSIGLNDGTRKILRSNIPLTTGAYWNFRSFKRLQVKVRVQPGRVTVEARSEGESKWIQLATASGSIKPGTYPGFTGFVDKGARALDEVMIDDVVVENFDDKQQGETQSLEKPGRSSQQDTNALFNQGEVAEQNAVSALSRAVYRLVSESSVPRKSLLNSVSHLSGKLDSLEVKVKALKEELKAVSGQDLDAELDAMKEQLFAVTKQATQGEKSRHQNIQKVAKKGGKLKWFLWLGLAGIFVVVLVGLGVGAKVTSWEKKHLL